LAVDNIEVCQRVADFEIKEKNCSFGFEGLGHNTDFRLKPSELIVDHQSLARYFSVSFDI
jgi:hypothetical protein